jgi:hypothetical protein
MIIDYKPKLSERTVKEYVNTIIRLHKKLKVKEELPDLDFLKDSKPVLKSIEDLAHSTQKTMIASIITIMRAYGDDEPKYLESYEKVMMELAVEYAEKRATGVKSQRQEENWLDYPQIKKALARVHKDLKDDGVLSREKLNKTDFKRLQAFVIVSMYMLDPENNPPLRLDVSMKMIGKAAYDKMDEKEKLKDNYLVTQSKQKKMFSFGEFKTSKSKGLLTIDVGKVLNSLLNIWIPHTDGESLFVNIQGKRMSDSSLSKAITGWFQKHTGKAIGSQMLRNIWVSHKFPKTEDDDRERVASLMAHSVNEQKGYSKKD